jgi:hypothetical protein
MSHAKPQALFDADKCCAGQASSDETSKAKLPISAAYITSSLEDAKAVY